MIVPYGMDWPEKKEPWDGWGGAPDEDEAPKLNLYGEEPEGD